MSENAQPAPPAGPAAKKGKKKVFIFAALALVVGLGGGAGAYWATHRGAPAEADAEGGDGAGAQAKPAPKARKAEHPGLVSLEPFVVNLADPGGSRFLRVSVRLIVESPEEGEKIQKDDVALMRARASILEVLTTQTADRVVTPEGKDQLKQSIIERMHKVLEGDKVIDVLFSDFVVQF